MRARMPSLVIVCLMTLAACSGSGPVASPPPIVATDLDPGGSPSGLAFDFGSLWVGIADKGTVSRIDPATGKVIKSITVGDPTKLLAHARVVHGAPSAVISGFGAIWAVGSDGKLARIDPATNAATMFDVGVVGGALAAGEGAIWITSYDDVGLVRFDPAAGKVSRVTPDLGGLFGVDVGFGSVWTVNKTGHEVLRIDPTTGAVIARIPAERSPDWLTVGAGSVWVTRETPRAVLRIDPLTNAVTSAIAGDASWGLGTAIEFFDGAVWTGYLVRIDAATEKVAGSFSGYGDQKAAAFGGGFAWVADVTRLHRVPLALVH